ncbi:GNAT family N-acetyltransferase [Sutcliffiella horikoshii]
MDEVKFLLYLKKQLVGYIRRLTDQSITLYICELLVDRIYRGLGLGK